MTKVYFVRHAEPNYNNHDDLTRELTEKGLRDREKVTEFLADKEIDVVMSSPFKRAYDTVKHFADSCGETILVVDDFRERKIDNVWIPDFNSFCERQWQDFDYKLADGESLREVQARNIAALEQVLAQYPDKNVAIGGHGTAISMVLNYYDPAFDYGEYNKVRRLMPFVAELDFEGQKCIGAKVYDLNAVSG